MNMIDINLPDVVAEVREAFARYEQALVGNDVDALDRLFWESPHALRYGVTENLYGYSAIAAFRAARSPAGLQRTLMNTVITTFGREFATASTEFRRVGAERDGRQTQTWVRLHGEWHIVAAHVSLLQEKAKP